MSFDTPLLVIILFLLSTLIIGLYSAQTCITFRAYAVGNRQFSTSILVMTLLASIHGSGMFRQGISYFFCCTSFFWPVWQVFINSLIFLVMSWLAGRMRKCMYHLSMPETIGRAYGKYPRMIAALVSVYYLVGVTALQISGITQVMGMCIPLNKYMLTIFATIILCVYSILGGIRAVTLTDLWQLITFFSIIVVCIWVVSRGIHKPVHEIIPFLETQKHIQWNVQNLFFPFKNKLLPILYYLALLAYIEPSTIQMVYMSSSPMQARKVFLYASVFSIVIIGCVLLIGLCLFIHMPSLAPGAVYDYLLANVPPYLKGLIAICLLAMAMSTADSKLHTTSILIIHDVLSNIGCIRIRSSNRYQLLLAHITMLATSLLAMLLAFHKGFAYSYRLSNMVSITCLYAAIVVAPFILAVLGLCSSSPAAFLGMVAGLLTLWVWDKWMSAIVGETSGTFVAILTNGLTMLTTHYLLLKFRHIKAARS